MGRLKELKDRTNLILADADKTAFPNCAVNWGDLSCTDVESVHSLNSKEVEYRVYVGEADPGSKAFADYISDELTTAGFDEVDVRLAW